MADKDTKDTHKVTQPKAKTEYSLPNDLKESLDDLESYEKLTDDLKLNSVDGDRMETEKHKPVDGEPELKHFDKDINKENIRDEVTVQPDKDVKKVHEEAPYTAVTNLTASDHSTELERKIKDSNKSKGGVKYFGDPGPGESRRQPKDDKYKNIDRTKITDVLAALADAEAFGKLKG